MAPKSQKLTEKLAGVEGLEPPTLGLEIRCSIRLSYTPEGAANAGHVCKTGDISSKSI